MSAVNPLDSLPPPAGTILLSVVLPTTGKESSLRRCLESFTNGASDWLRSVSEIVIFFNRKSPKNQLPEKLQAYIQSLGGVFREVHLIESTRFELTAEESAFAATANAHGEYIMLCGDKRVFLPEGLSALERWLHSPNTPCAYFNGLWTSEFSRTNGYAALHFSASSSQMPYRQFVLQAGLNYMSTTMGLWVFEAKRLDRTRWAHIIDVCGPHFSHVTLTLATIADDAVNCHAAFLCLLEQKAYHAGDVSEWANYARLAKTYRFYPWTLGLVRHFEYLISLGVYSYNDVRHAMCTEGPVLKRQVEDIYVHLLAQLRRGWVQKSERLSAAEFDEIMNFLSRTCPEMSILNMRFRQIFNTYNSMKRIEYTDLIEGTAQALEADQTRIIMGSLITAQVGGQYIRRHPQGYIASDITDDRDFLLAYKLMDPPRKGKGWLLMTANEFKNEQYTHYPWQFTNILPSPDLGERATWNLRRRLARRLWRSPFAMMIFVLLPDRLQYKAKRLLGVA